VETIKTGRSELRMLFVRRSKSCGCGLSLSA